jgi:hypothetical protein
MDGPSFDRVARLLGAAASRRAGLRAAFGAAFGASGLAAAEATEARKDRDRRNRTAGNDDGKNGRAGAAGDVTAQGPCKSTRRKDNICTIDGECCSKWCDKSKGQANNDQKGRCRCRRRNSECQIDINCCKRGGQQMSCIKNRCGYRIPTTMRCKVGGWACKESGATCTSYMDGVSSRLYCLFGVNRPCTNDAQCTTGFCSNGICKYQLTDACGDAGANTCGDRRASCTTYRFGADVTPRCLLPEGQSCGANNECVTAACVGGFCVEGVPTSVSCLGDPRDFCANPDASCTGYSDTTNGQGTYCLLDDGYACIEDAECLNGYCIDGTCQACTLGLPGASCTTDGDCCDNYCSVVNGSGRCIGKKTVWAWLEWTDTPYSDPTAGTIDTWVWMPQTVPQATISQTTNCSPTNCYPTFANGGDVLTWWANWYPYDDIADPETDTPDVWTDVDDIDTPGSERTLWFRPVPKGTYRFAIKNYDLCTGDDGSTTACGSSWSGINPDFGPFTSPAWAMQVVFYEYNKEIRKFVLPWGVTGSDGNVDHYYWWQVTDVTFDENGWFKEFTTPMNSANGIIRDCAPVLFPGNVGGETSNICPYN